MTGILSFVLLHSLLSDGGLEALCARYPNFDSNATPDDTCGASYLNYACANNNFVVVCALVIYGANVAQKDVCGITPLRNACWGRHGTRVKLVKCILECPEGLATLHFQDTSGYTPLMTAAQFGNTEIVRVLLEYEIDPTTCTDLGESAVDFARQQGHIEIVKLLHTATLSYLCEWRPRKHKCYPPLARATMRTLLLLAKSTI